MIAKFEEINFNEINVWAGKYKSLSNIAHWHKETEIIHIERGRAEIGINKEIWEAVKGETFFVDSGDIHYISGSADSVISILIFAPEIAKKILLANSLASRKLINTLDCFGAVTDIQGEIKMKKPFYEEKVYSLINGFIADIFRSEPLSEERRPNRDLLAYREIIQYIDSNFSNTCFSDAAKKSGYCEAHFSKLFKKLTGSSFTDYLNHLRVEKALEMIWGKKDTITNIAFACGFNSVRHFNRVFKKETGFIPKETPININSGLLNIKKASVGFFDPTLENSRLLE